MKCPECLIPLRREKQEEIELDICSGCEGIWFDCGELTKYRERRLLGAVRLGEEQAKFVAAGGGSPKICPRCETSTVLIGTLGSFRSVGRCSNCQGIYAFDAKTLVVRQFLEVISYFVGGFV